MSNNAVFRYRDSSTINFLLHRIGINRLRLECSNKGIEFPKQLSRLYLEQSLGPTAAVELKYIYRGHRGQSIMTLDNSLDLPTRGWERVTDI